MIKKILVLMTSVVSMTLASTAMAADYAYPEQFEADYTIDSFGDSGSRIYYNCDSVESNTKSLLKQLGAEDVKVRCTGGFDPYIGFTGPAYVTAKFTAPTFVKNNATPRLASVKEIELRRTDDCHFMKSTLEGLAGEIQLDIVDGPNTCWSGRNSSARFTVSVLAFEE